MNIELDQIDRRLVTMLQSDFPLTREPFAELATRLGLDEQEVLKRTEQLRSNHVIRIIGPVFNSRSLGYQSTLVAMHISEEKIERSAEIINRHKGVGHNYQRDHYYNLWFTLAIRGDADLKETLREFEEQVAPESMFELPATKIFKIRLFFDLEGNGNHSSDEIPPEMQSAGSLSLSDTERIVANEVQRQLPLVKRPFDRMAANAGMCVDDFLAGCRSLKERGLIRRFGASIEQRNAGFTSNALVCWDVPGNRVDEAGRIMAGFKEITHCYERRTCPQWPRYNIFTMIHGDSRENIEAILSLISAETGMSEYEVLPTVREFKKERLKYEV